MSWTHERVRELRNKASARAKLCAPVVQEAEELTQLISTCDAVLSGTTPVPFSNALRGLQLATLDEMQNGSSTSIVASIPATQQSVLNLIVRHEGEALRPAKIASTLGMPMGSVSSALARLMKLKQIKRVGRGRYACAAETIRA